MYKVELKPISESRKTTIVRKALTSAPQQQTSNTAQKVTSNDLNRMLNRAFKAASPAIK